MGRLFHLHLVEHRGAGRVALAESVRKLTVNAAVFLFERDGEREDFRFGQVAKILRHISLGNGRGATNAGTSDPAPTNHVHAGNVRRTVPSAPCSTCMPRRSATSASQ